MNYHTSTHPAFSNYLHAVEEALIKAKVPPKAREEIQDNLIAQFEDAANQSPAFNESNYVAELDDPRTYAASFIEDVPAEVKETRSAGRKGGSARVVLLLMAVLLVATTVIYVLKTRNQAVVADTAVDASWAEVETALQRRFDLIPNLVNTVKGFATQERELLTRVTELRSQWGAAREPGQQLEVAGKLEEVLGRVVAVSEQYPTLASSEHYLALQYQLEGTENRIAVARTRYNQALQHYNTIVRQFPANLLGFQENGNFFKAAEEAKSAPKVEL